MLSADPDLGADLTDLFNHLTGYSHQGEYRKLLVAPVHLRRAHRRPHRAAGRARRGGPDHDEDEQPRRPGADRRALRRVAAGHARSTSSCAASAACDPGCPGLSDNIRVRSIVGRFLEHSRIYRFGADADTAEYLIGSADLMPRNLDHRVEALVPVTDPRLRARLDEMLELDLADDMLAWELAADGSLAQDPDRRRRLHPPRAAGARGRAGPRLLSGAVSVGNAFDRWSASSSSHPRPSRFRIAGLRRDELTLEPTSARRQLRCKPRTSTPPTSGSRARARASASATTTAGRSSCPAGRRRARPVRAPRRGGPGDPPDGALDLVRALVRRAPVALVARHRHGPPPGRAPRRRRRRSSPSWSTTRCRCSTVRVWPTRFRELEVEFADDRVGRARPTTSPHRLQHAGAGEPEHDPEDRARPRAAGARRPPTWSPPGELDFASTPTRRPAGGDRPLDRAAARARSRRPHSARTPRTCTRRVSRPAGCAPTSRRSERALDPGVGRVDCATSSSGWAGLLGAVRDADVLLERLDGAGSHELPTDDHAAGERLLDILRDARARAREPSCSPRCAPTATSTLARAPARGGARGPVVGRRRRLRARARRSRRRSRGRSCATRCATSATSHPTRTCTRCASAPSGHATPPRRWPPRSARPRSGSRRRSRPCRRCSASTRTRSSPGSGCATHVPDGDGRRAPRSSPESSPLVEDVADGTASREQWPAAWKHAKRREAPRGGCERATQTVRAAGGIVAPAATDGALAGAARAPAPVRRLEPAQGQGRPGRARRGDRAARGRGGDGPTLRARRAAGETRYRDSKGRDKVVHYWLMEPASAAGRRIDAFVPNDEVDDGALVQRSPRPPNSLSYAHDRKLLAKAPVPA